MNSITVHKLECSKSINWTRKTDLKSGFKGIVLGKISTESMDNFTVNNYCKRELLKPSNIQKDLFQYVIDKEGMIYQFLPETLAGTVCKFNTYSSKMCKLFPVHCPPTDARYYPRDIGPDDILLTIMVIVDEKSTMSEKQTKNLKFLVKYLMRQSNYKSGEDINCIYTRDQFPRDTVDKKRVGQLFPKTTDFMIFKKLVRDVKSEITAEYVD